MSGGQFDGSSLLSLLPSSSGARQPRLLDVYGDDVVRSGGGATVADAEPLLDFPVHAKDLSAPPAADFGSFAAPLQQHGPAKQLYVEEVIQSATASPPVHNFDIPPFLDHEARMPRIILHPGVNLPQVLELIQATLRNSLVDCTLNNTPTADMNCAAQRFGDQITFNLRFFSLRPTTPLNPTVGGFVMEMSRERGDGMEFNDVFRTIYHALNQAKLLDASDGPAPEVPQTAELSASMTFDLSYAEETITCFLNMCRSELSEVRREGLCGLSDLIMTENALLYPLFIKLRVAELFLSLLWTPVEDTHRCALGSLASLALHPEICRFLAVQSVPRNVFLSLARMLPTPMPRTMATVRQSLRLLCNMASVLRRDLLQNCVAEAKHAIAQINAEGIPEFIELVRTLQNFTGGFDE